MIKVVLSAILVCIFMYAVSQSKRSRFISAVISACCAVGVIFVLAPDLTTMLANWLGVGRGADLLIYLFVVITTMFAIFNIHLRLRANIEQMTSLVRAMTLKDTQEPKH